MADLALQPTMSEENIDQVELQDKQEPLEKFYGIRLFVLRGEWKRVSFVL